MTESEKVIERLKPHWTDVTHIKINCEYCGTRTIPKEWKDFIIPCENGSCMTYFCSHCVGDFKDHGYYIKINEKEKRVVLCHDCSEDNEDLSKLQFLIKED